MAELGSTPSDKTVGRGTTELQAFQWVQTEVNKISEKLDKHSAAIGKIASDGKVLSEKVKQIHEAANKSDVRIEKINEKIDANYNKLDESIRRLETQVARWGGGLAVLIVIIGFGLAILRFIPASS